MQLKNGKIKRLKKLLVVSSVIMTSISTLILTKNKTILMQDFCSLEGNLSGEVCDLYFSVSPIISIRFLGTSALWQFHQPVQSEEWEERAGTESCLLLSLGLQQLWELERHQREPGGDGGSLSRLGGQTVCQWGSRQQSSSHRSVLSSQQILQANIKY